ncbi:MAG: Alpha/beta hydrolase family protein [Planctomycetaceae bacterium]|nr:Alpha/beta hydrolase family protein [Planctomycetaceae bacterium]
MRQNADINDPGGISEISRGLSVLATPPVPVRIKFSIPEGSQTSRIRWISNVKNSSILPVLVLFLLFCVVPQRSVADQKYGHERTVFTLSGHQGFVIRPAKPAADGTKPWAWYAPTFINGYPNQSNEWLFKQLLDAGWTIAGMEVGESFGSPAGRKIYSEFYAHVVQEYGLNPKACLVPQSRGGLMLYNWAVEHPDQVQCIAGIYTVCDLRSYPGLKNAAPAYGLTEDELTNHLKEHNPIDRLEPLAKAKIPILHIHGDSDTVVPLDRNSQVVYDRYKALGGPMELLVIKGKGHAEIPEFFQSPEMLKFLLSQKK